MRRQNGWGRHALRFALFAAIVIAAVGGAVMLLWNLLLPGLFGVPAIGFAQALGLFVLSRILVGGLRSGRGGRMHWRARMAARWAGMSEEERARWREGMRHRCGRTEGPAAPTA
jgi:hypothetical protein